MNIEHRVIKSSGKNIHSINWKSENLPFHFLHANGLCAGTYIPLFDMLKSNFSICATDIPGHGDSSHHGYAKITHWNIFVDHIKESITKNMSTPVVGAGHSLGAVVTLLAAVKYPDLFSRIVLIDPVIFPRYFLWLYSFGQKTGFLKGIPLSRGARRRKKEFHSRKEALERFMTGRGMFKTWPDEFIESYCSYGLRWNGRGEGLLKCNPETEAQIYESILLDIWDYPKKISCPVLIIRGEKSDTFVKSAALKLKGMISNSELSTIKDAGHFVPMEKPHECSAAIIDFAGVKK